MVHRRGVRQRDRLADHGLDRRPRPRLPGPVNDDRWALQQIASDVLGTASAAKVDGSDLMPTKVGAGKAWPEPTTWISGQHDLATALNTIDASFPRSS